MKLSFDTVKKIFKRRDQSGLSVFGRGQHFDWETLLTMFLVATAIVVLLSIRVFLDVRKGDIFKVEKEDTTRVKTIDRKVLEDALDKQAEKERMSENLRATKPSVVDPSL